MAEFVSLKVAAARCQLSRHFIKRLVERRSVSGKYVEPLKRWRINWESLRDYLASKGYDLATQVTTVAVIGAPPDWSSRLAELLPAGMRAVHAAGCFDAGRVFERERPTIAVIDCRMGRGEAIDLGLRLTRANLRCVGLANEDESEAKSLTQEAFVAVLRRPVQLGAVRDAVTRIVGGL